MKGLDQQDDGAVMQNLAWDVRIRIDDPMSVEATFKPQDLRYDNRRSDTGEGPACFLPLARRGIFPTVHGILNVFIRRANSGNSFTSQTAIICSVSPGVPRRNRWADQQTDDKQVKDWRSLNTSDKHGGYNS